jgi:hypothetical protein
MLLAFSLVCDAYSDPAFARNSSAVRGDDFPPGVCTTLRTRRGGMASLDTNDAGSACASGLAGLVLPEPGKPDSELSPRSARGGCRYVGVDLGLRQCGHPAGRDYRFDE